MHPLVRSLAFHLVAPYVVQLALVYLLIHSVSKDALIGFLFFGGYIALIGITLVAVPFGIAHLVQAFSLALRWSSARTQFLTGLLNPSFAAITVTGVLYLDAARII